jgi:prepilin-type N-terminal cleavage/methylation domain-containing protein
MKDPRQFTHPVAMARRATRRRLERDSESGFTLIELIVTIAILPLVVGGISVALISIFSLSGSVNNRIGDSNDALVGSVNFNRDVQSAEQMTVSPTVACGPTPAQTNPAQTQLLGLQWAANVSAPGSYDSVVSYVSVPVVNPQTNETTYKMIRQTCSYTSGPTLTLTSSSTIARDIGPSPSLTCSPMPSVSTLCITGANGADVTSSFAPSATNASGWSSAQGVTGVTFKIVAPGSQYTYSLVGLPGESTSQSSASNLTNPTGPGCGFAATGSGTYANQLCFADFTGVTNPPLHSSGTCQTVTRPIANTPYTLSFCISVSQNNVVPATIPTYYSPQGDDSEAFLGNNGFYTGIPGNPALYQTSGGITTAYLTNIKVLDAASQPATGWTLVTGDAESTDTNEWMVFQSNLNLTVLNNSPGNPYGNACYDDQDAGNSGFLDYTGPTPPTTSQTVTSPANSNFLGSLMASVKGAAPAASGNPSVLCESDQQLNKTGTLMLSAQEPAGTSAAQTLTVTMRGSGLEALFVGVLL